MIVMTDENAVAAIYDNPEKAETAVKELRKGGFDMKRLSIVGPEERLTLLDLVAGVQDAAESDAEVTSTLRHMFETGRVRLDSLSVQEHAFGA